MNEAQAIDFVNHTLKRKASVFVTSRDGVPQNIPALLLSGAVLLTIENDKVTGVEITP